MKSFALAALLLSACAMPFKYQTFNLGPWGSDVIWVYHKEALWRCWQSGGHPMCQAASMRVEQDHPMRAENNEPTPPAKPAVASPPLPEPTREAPTPQYPDYTK